MKQPPEILQPIWMPLADITGWFNWDALSAIGTVGALWFVVVQTTRVGRAELARSVGILTVLIGLIEPIEVVPIYENTTDSDLKNMPGDERQHGMDVVRGAREGLASLPLADAYAVGVAEWTMALPLALKEIHEALGTRKLEEPSSVFSALRYCQEATVHFRDQRDRLQYGWLRRMLRRYFPQVLCGISVC